MDVDEIKKGARFGIRMRHASRVLELGETVKHQKAQDPKSEVKTIS